MDTFLLILVGIATLIFLANIIRMPSRYGRAYQRGQQIAEDHPNLGWRELTDVQNMHASQFPDDDSINGFWAGYKGLEYNEEGYDPDQDQENETIEEHLSFWQKMNRK
jgi:hypothetical protein